MEASAVKRVSAAIVSLAGVAMLVAACGAPPGAAGGFAPAQSNDAATGERVTVEKGPVESRIIATGKVGARRTATVAFPRSGTVASLLVKEGDQVKAGQPLASLDTRDLELTARQQYASYISAQASFSQTVQGPTEAELKSAKAALSSAQAAYSDLYTPPSDNEVASLKATLMNAEATLKAKQSAYDNAYRRDPAGIGASPAALELEKATNDFNAAKANYDKAFEKPASGSAANASAQIASAKAKIESLMPVTETIIQAQAKLDQAYLAWQQAEQNVKDATIVAPYDGMVIAVNFDVGDSASAGGSTIQIADFDEPVFEVAVDEADLGSVSVGQDARILLQTYPKTPIPAKVDSISIVGTDNGSIVTYKVKLVVPKSAAEQGPNILLGMSGTSEIITARTDDALLIPNRALIVNSADKTYSVLRVKPDGSVETVPVKLGYQGADTSQVLGDVNAGEVLLIPSAATQSVPSGFGPGFEAPGGGPPPGGN